jgi:HEAT repeat protein
VNRRREVVVAGYLGDVPTATEALDDSSPDVRAAALGALARLEALTDAHLKRALTDPDRSVVRRAIELSINVPKVELLPLVERRDSTIVEVAAWALGERGAGQPVEVVERLSQMAASHSDALVREAAVAALGSIGAEGGLPAILGAMDDKAAVRRRAVVALAAYEGPEVEAALARALGDRDWQVRQAAEDLTTPPDHPEAFSEK